MGKVNIPIGVLLLGIIMSCESTKNVFKETFVCYEGLDAIHSNELVLNGYYAQQEFIEYYDGYLSQKINDTIQRNSIFYKDGVFIYSFYPEQFKGKKALGYNGGMALWGRYLIHRDTIKAYFMTGTKNKPNRPWGYVWFKIIDSTTIKEICYKWREPITQNDLQSFQEKRAKNITDATFISYESLPDPDKSWIKNKKWFWCDEKKYKEWKKKMRNK